MLKRLPKVAIMLALGAVLCAAFVVSPLGVGYGSWGRSGGVCNFVSGIRGGDSGIRAVCALPCPKVQKQVAIADTDSQESTETEYQAQNSAQTHANPDFAGYSQILKYYGTISGQNLGNVYANTNSQYFSQWITTDKFGASNTVASIAYSLTNGVVDFRSDVIPVVQTDALVMSTNHLWNIQSLLFNINADMANIEGWYYNTSKSVKTVQTSISAIESIVSDNGTKIYGSVSAIETGISKVLTSLSTINESLGQLATLHKDMDTASARLLVLSNNFVTAMNDYVKPLAGKLDTIAEKSETINTSIGTVDKSLGKINTNLDGVNKTLNLIDEDMLNAFDNIQPGLTQKELFQTLYQIVYGNPTGKVGGTSLYNEINKTTSYVEEMHEVMFSIEDMISSIDNAIKKIVGQGTDLQPVVDAVNKQGQNIVDAVEAQKQATFNTEDLQKVVKDSTADIVSAIERKSVVEISNEGMPLSDLVGYAGKHITDKAEGKFPFSLVSVVTTGLGMLSEQPATPEITFTLPSPTGWVTQSVSLDYFEPLRALTNLLSVIALCVGLAFATKSFVFNR